MSLASNKIVLANAATNTAGAYNQPITLYTGTGATTGVTVPAGFWQMLATTNVVVQMNTSNNANALSWTNISTVNTAAFFMSDGFNFQAISTNTSNITVTLYGPNGGNAVSGTYNAK